MKSQIRVWRTCGCTAVMPLPTRPARLLRRVFNYDYSDSEIGEVAERAKNLAAEAEEVHVVFNNNALDYAPRAGLAFAQGTGADREDPAGDGELFNYVSAQCPDPAKHSRSLREGRRDCRDRWPVSSSGRPITI